MSEVWYRGEGIGIAPASGGMTAPHDLGDGMYLTDNPRSAKAYAELRTSDVAKQRVYSVRIDRSSLRILDLTGDARWREFVKPVEPMLKTGAVNENYGRTFQNFVQHYKIDLSKYDAVIGPDYVRGGRQMNILNQNGQPTRLHAAIRRLFQVFTPANPNAVKINPSRNWTPKVNFRGRAIRIAGGLGLTIVLSIIGGWLQARWEKGKIEEGLEKVDKELKQRLELLTADIARFQLKLDEDEKVYANVTTEIHFGTPYAFPHPKNYDYPYDGAPTVWLTDVQITSRDVKYEETEKMFGARIERYVQSFEVEVYSSEELERFSYLSTEYLSYKRKLGMNPTNPVYFEEARRLRDLIVQGFGEDVWFLQIEQYTD